MKFTNIWLLFAMMIMMDWDHRMKSKFNIYILYFLGLALNNFFENL